jgi:hypothetical protein
MDWIGSQAPSRRCPYIRSRIETCKVFRCALSCRWLRLSGLPPSAAAARGSRRSCGWVGCFGGRTYRHDTWRAQGQRRRRRSCRRCASRRHYHRNGLADMPGLLNGTGRSSTSKQADTACACEVVWVGWACTGYVAPPWPPSWQEIIGLSVVYTVCACSL